MRRTGQELRSMADAPPKICGWRKKDLDGKEARLVAVAENLQPTDDVQIVYPQSRQHPYLRIIVNGDLIKEKYIPEDVIEKKCTFKVKRKKNRDAEIKITLRKERVANWEGKWSPSHDGLHGNPPIFPLPASSDVSIDTSCSTSSTSHQRLTITEIPEKKKHKKKRRSKETTSKGEDSKDKSDSSSSSSSESESDDGCPKKPDD